MQRQASTVPVVQPQQPVQVVVLGKSGAGKSALVVRYLTQRFIGEYDPFLENTYHRCEVLKPENETLQLSVIDTFDHETLEVERLTRMADAIVLVYAINSVASFERVRSLLVKITPCQSQTASDWPLSTTVCLWKCPAPMTANLFAALFVTYCAGISPLGQRPA